MSVNEKHYKRYIEKLLMAEYDQQKMISQVKNTYAINHTTCSAFVWKFYKPKTGSWTGSLIYSLQVVNLFSYVLCMIINLFIANTKLVHSLKEQCKSCTVFLFKSLNFWIRWLTDLNSFNKLFYLLN